jgi:glycosyltransferase involved in cell wall biosynthesis
MSRSLAVLVTYHNERELLRECLESVLSPADRPDEVIVYDDASSAPAAEYVPAGVRVIRGEINVGPSVGRNRLLAAATRDFVHFHDADDLFHPDWCSRTREAIARDVDAVFTEVSAHRGNELVAERVIGLSKVVDGQDLIEFCIDGVMLVPAGTYRRSVLSEVGGYRERLWQSEDFDFHIRLAASGIRWSILDEPLVLQRLRPDGRSQHGCEASLGMLESLCLLASELPARYRPALAERAVRVGSVLFRAGAPADASRAFALAASLGRPSFRHERRTYRLIARGLGPEFAERVGSVYRAVLPQALRRPVAGAGW